MPRNPRRPAPRSAGLLHLRKLSSGSVHIRHPYTGELSIPRASGATISFAPNVVGVNTKPGGTAFNLGGEAWIGTTTTISSTATIGATSLSAAASVSPGWYILGSAPRASLAVGGDLMSGGEYVRVTSTGTTATLASPIVQSYSAGSTLRAINEAQTPVGIGNTIIGGRFIANGSTESTIGSAWVVQLANQVGLAFSGVQTRGGRIDALRLLQCHQFSARKISTRGNVGGITSTTGIGYGFAVNWSGSGTITGVSGVNNRHAIGLHRLCHNIRIAGVYAETCSALFDIHDGASSITATQLSHATRTFADGVQRTPLELGRIQLGNASHINPITGLTIDGFVGGDIALTHNLQSSFIRNGTFRRAVFVGIGTGTVGGTSTFRLCEFRSCTATGLASTTVGNVGETVVSSGTPTIQVGSGSTTELSMDRVVFSACNLESFSPAHTIDIRGRQVGTFTAFSMRVDESSTVFCKSGASAGGRALAGTGWGAVVVTPFRVELVNANLRLGSNTSANPAGNEMVLTASAGSMTYVGSNATFTNGSNVSVALNTNHIGSNVTWATSASDKSGAGF